MLRLGAIQLKNILKIFKSLNKKCINFSRMCMYGKIDIKVHFLEVLNGKRGGGGGNCSLILSNQREIEGLILSLLLFYTIIIRVTYSHEILNIFSSAFKLII